MKVGLLSADASFKAWLQDTLTGATQSAFDFSEVKAYPAADIEFLLVCVNGDESDRTHRAGLHALRQLRLDARRCNLPALVCSFEPRCSLEDEFPFLGEGIPGVSYLQMPFTASAFEKEMSKLDLLTPRELQDLIRWHSGLQREWAGYVHDLVGVIKKGEPIDRDLARSILDGLSDSVRQYAPDQIKALLTLEEVFDSPLNLKGLLEAIKELHLGLSKQILQEERFEAPINLPPKGYSTIAIADDEGYPQSVIDNLKLYGYTVLDPTANVTDAVRQLDEKLPQVVIVDLHLPSDSDGLAVMRHARDLPSKPIVLAISDAFIDEGVLPKGVADVSGSPLISEDVKTIHDTIWHQARLRGIRSDQYEETNRLKSDQSLAEKCQWDLERLANDLLIRVYHWRALSKKVLRGLRYLRLNLPKLEHQEADLASEIESVLRNYEREATGEAGLSYANVRALKDEGYQLRSRAGHLLPRAATLHPLQELLHNTIEQNMDTAAKGLDGCRARLTAIIEQLRSLPLRFSEPFAREIEMRREAWESDSTLEHLSLLAQGILKVSKRLPRSKAPAVRRAPIADVAPARHYRLAIIEDEEEWQAFVQRAAELANRLLGTEIEIRTVLFNNKSDAIESLNRQGNEDVAEQLIAVVDMGLPADSDEAKRVKAGETMTTRENGHEVIKALRAYRYNVPCIVLTTSPELLEDLRRVREHGVHDAAYILKGPDKEEEYLAHKICDLILPPVRKSHTIEISESPVTECRIDGLNVELGNKPFFTFYALCKLSKETGEGKYHTREEISSFVRRHFKEKSSRSNSIKDHINDIRDAIHHEFSSAGLRIGKTEIIANERGGAGYRIAIKPKDIIFIEDGGYVKRVGSSFRALIVENEDAYASAIENLLTEIQITVVDIATNAEDAITKAQQHRPDMISLDLQIPSGRHNIDDRLVKSNGLSALRLIRKNLDKEISVAILTQYADDLDLIEEAVNLDVPVPCIVPKGQSGWEGMFLRIALELQRQADRHSRLFSMRRRTLPVLRVQRQMIKKERKLYLMVNGAICPPLAGWQAVLVNYLLDYCGQVVPDARLISDVLRGYSRRRAASYKNRLKMYEREIHKKIESTWLRGYPKADELALEVLERVEGVGLRFNVDTVEDKKIKKLTLKSKKRPQNTKGHSSHHGP